MIPTIEEIIEGMEVGTYSKEQGIAWLKSHAAMATYGDDDRLMVSAMAMQAWITTTGEDGEQARRDVDCAAKWAVENADALIAALNTPPSGNYHEEKQ